MEMEGSSTELRIYFEFAETSDRNVTDEEVEFVKSVLEDHGLSYDHYDKYNISTEFFPDTDGNMGEVDEIVSKIDDYFNNFTINRFTEDREIYGVQAGTYQTWVSIEQPRN